ncbi:MAG: ATP-binding cassette domain-containing protein [Thermoguttaceae bacterium]|jgi:putative ABC transport system ATP-binding protein
MITIKGAEFAYPDRLFSIAIDDLHIAAGSRTVLLGPSGSGKSTLMGIFAGIHLPHTGLVEIRGESIQDKSDTWRRRFRLRNIGMVFQGFALLPYLKVYDNIRLPVLADRSLRQEEAHKRCDALLESVGLDGYGNRWPDQLSHGERQRVAICRALFTSPGLVLADEPTGNLDSVNTSKVMDMLIRAVTRQHATLVMSTHNQGLLDSFDTAIDVESLRGRLEE